MTHPSTAPQTIGTQSDQDNTPKLPRINPPLAQAIGLTKTYGKGGAAVHALRGVNLGFSQGQFTAIMGPSGSGKSTLMHCLAGLEAPTSGSIEVAGQSVSTMSARQRSEFRRLAIGLVFPSDNLLPALTVSENIRLPLAIARQSEDRQWFDQIIDAFELNGVLSRRPGALSAGQQQRVACARAMILQPAVVLADEPTGSLDWEAGEHLLAMLRACVATFGQTMVLATHDAQVAGHADQVYLLRDGQVVDQTSGSAVERLLGGGSLS